jgi:hypothetical protein
VLKINRAVEGLPRKSYLELIPFGKCKAEENGDIKKYSEATVPHYTQVLQLT